uniref:Thioredoxin-like fold domain-containing protein n=1 Tax=Calcidiscus leptoporus TaxID=127549 RepID=A0A7S0JD73_9EUKA|mmetsp:Transcript_52361/g.120359  ORF Transcript_52361/g.120359 Transcript_52361/m.120359 type:complete len:221 (+) Transcript_52361:68-730(+)
MCRASWCLGCLTRTTRRSGPSFCLTARTACQVTRARHQLLARRYPMARCSASRRAALRALSWRRQKKLAQATGASKVIISFDSVTCPFWRAYAAEDLYRAVPGIPTLHVCIREAHPLDEFDAEGANTSGPLQLTREFNKHKTLSDRRASAKEAKALISKFEPGEITMFVDGMDDKLEALYEARPWRQYVIEAATGKMIDAIGLTPFQMEDKIAAIKAACA